jgi:ankyrin repeat protein
MSARASALDDEPEIVDHAHGATDNDGQEGEGSDSSEEESDDESTATKRLNEIRRGLKNDELDLHDKTKLEDFIHRNESYLDKRFDGEGDHENLLHLIAKDARDKAFDKYQPLVKVLLDRHPHLLEEKDLHEDTPLHLAINKKRDKFVRFICKTYTRKDINTILGIRNHSGNCLHVAIKKNIPIKLAVFLIGYAGEGTLHAKDNNGNTPLHIAVEYKRCTNAQLEIVQALVSKCDLAMSERTKDSLSPYQYHHHTRKEAKKEAAKENRVQLGKMNGTGTSGNGISGWNSGPEERDTAVMGSNFSGAPLDTDVPGSIRSLKLAENTSFDMEGGKLGPLRRVKTGSEAPNGMLGSNAGSNRSPIDAGGIGNKYSDLRAPKDTSRPTTSNDTTTSVGLKPAKGERKSKEIAEVTDDTANMILDYLKLHCLQTRLHDDAVDFLYGPGQGMTFLEPSGIVSYAPLSPALSSSSEKGKTRKMHDGRHPEPIFEIYTHSNETCIQKNRYILTSTTFLPKRSAKIEYKVALIMRRSKTFCNTSHCLISESKRDTPL